MTAARDLRIEFDPKIADPDPDSPHATSAASALVRRFGKTTNVLGPGTEMVQIYWYPMERSGSETLVNDEDVPEEVTVSVTYYAGPDRHEYTDDFELDVHNVGLSTSVNSKDNPAVQSRSMTKSLEAIAKGTAAIARATEERDGR
jgi:hypothetical protein